MTLQAKLTLGTVLLATVIVAIVSMVYLGNVMDLQFESALRGSSARGRCRASARAVMRGNSRPDLSLSEALANGRITDRLQTEVALDSHIVEVAVADAKGEILADNFPERIGQYVQLDREPACSSGAGRLDPQVVRVLYSKNTEQYVVERNMGPPPIFGARGGTVPETIRGSMQPAITQSASAHCAHHLRHLRHRPRRFCFRRLLFAL